MSYQHTTFAQLKTSLANRLGDTGGVYWLLGSNAAQTDELGLYIVEALRTWGLLTGYWRDSGQFLTTAGTGFYDISALQNSSAENLLSYSVTDKTVSTLIQYHLLEPAPGSSWTGSEQFTLTDITDALQHRRDQLLLETGAVLTSFTQNLGAGSLSFDLPDTTLQVRNIHWKGTTTGIDWPLTFDDIDNQRNFRSDYLTLQSIPQTFSSSSVKPLRYVIAPPPNEPGTLRVLAIRSGAPVTAAGVSLGIPDDMSWIVKWGAMADILGKEGPGQDLPRAYFCERRWKLGVALAQINELVVNAQINGVSLSPESVSRIDYANPNWYSSTGVPSCIASLRNYVALSPAPDGIYSVELDLVRKAVVPAADSDNIQIGREWINPILDYAEHLAAFKCGGVEFRHTYRAADNFFNAALSYDQRLASQHPSILELVRQSTRDDYVLPTKKKATSPPLEQITGLSEQSAQLKSLTGQ